MRRLRPQVFVRQSRVVKLHEYDPGGFERMTKELTASAPSAMKIKVVAPPDDNILTVGAQRFRCAEVLFPSKVNKLLDGNIFTVDAKRVCVRKCYSSNVSVPRRSFCQASRRLAVSPRKPRDSRRGQECVAGWR